VAETTNAMHNLWANGYWNKMTLAHGCYWHKCSFCDTSLDYIKRYSPAGASELVDRIEKIIKQTNQHGFHFTDEAAPPALLRKLAAEIISRGLNITWWTNIRFESSFDVELCELLAESGCIAVSGGLEVASDRLLKKINKGVTLETVANAAAAFQQAGIMIHAYLMYGFPSQTEQEIIDSLEVVRQLFELGLINSGFWHQFAMTVHSPVGLNPEKYGVQRVPFPEHVFAQNGCEHIDPVNCNYEDFSEGLSKSLYNFIHGVGFDMDLSEWFDFSVPPTQIPPNFVERLIHQP
ncbi:MAG TPA: radical SAM protein, partial [Bacteroidales bacterium]|nr:radical SAM protein [Bacteroidales bacterium]